MASSIPTFIVFWCVCVFLVCFCDAHRWAAEIAKRDCDKAPERSYCSEDKGAILKCRWNSEKWAMEGYVHDCGAGFECGKCYVNVYEDRVCKCLDLRKPPEFASPGRITWSGKVDDKTTCCSGITPLKGVIQRSKDGTYLLQMMGDDKSSVNIIVPNPDGSFTEYNGRTDVSCSRLQTRVDRRRKLSYVWHYFTRDNPNDYELVEENGDIIKWKIYHDNFGEAMGSVDDDRYWYMRVKQVDVEKNIAIPIYFCMRDAAADEYIYTYVDYQWTQPESFKISDYCARID